MGRRADRLTQADSWKLGVPNVQLINGLLQYELPSGELSRTDPLESTWPRRHNQRTISSSLDQTPHSVSGQLSKTR